MLSFGRFWLYFCIFLIFVQLRRPHRAVTNIKNLLRSCLNFIRKYFYHCEAGFGFFESVSGIFSFLSFGNSPLFPARCERKSTRKQFSNNPEIKFKQLLKIKLKINAT